MATKGLTTRRSERAVGMPSAAESFVVPSSLPEYPCVDATVRGLRHDIDANYQGKQAHNPVGVTSS